MTENRDFIRAAYPIFWLVVAVCGYFFMKELSMMLICLVAALTLSASLAPLARLLEARKIPRAVTVLTVYALVAALYYIVGVNLAGPIKEQAGRLFITTRDSILPFLLERGHEFFPSLFPDAASGNLVTDELKGKLMGKAGTVAASALKLTGNILGFLVNIIFVLFLTAYFVIEAKGLTEGLLKWLPPNKRQTVKDLLPGLETRLGGYVRGQILVSLAVSTIIFCGLALVGIEEALTLGVVSGLLNLVPFVGSLLTAVFSILVGFNSGGLTKALLVLGVFVVEQWLESNFIVPHLLGKQVDLHPLVVLFAVVIGGSLMGLSGALIAVPLATALLYLAEELYLKKIQEQN
jgi:predicted PurR-regulated permease PerM